MASKIVLACLYKQPNSDTVLIVRFAVDGRDLGFFFRSQFQRFRDGGEDHRRERTLLLFLLVVLDEFVDTGVLWPQMLQVAHSQEEHFAREECRRVGRLGLPTVTRAWDSHMKRSTCSGSSAFGASVATWTFFASPAWADWSGTGRFRDSVVCRMFWKRRDWVKGGASGLSLGGWLGCLGGWLGCLAG